MRKFEQHFLMVLCFCLTLIFAFPSLVFYVPSVFTISQLAHFRLVYLCSWFFFVGDSLAKLLLVFTYTSVVFLEFTHSFLLLFVVYDIFS